MLEHYSITPKLEKLEHYSITSKLEMLEHYSITSKLEMLEHYSITSKLEMLEHYSITSKSVCNVHTANVKSYFLYYTGIHTIIMSSEGVRGGIVVFNTTFNNISVISWRSVLLVEETLSHKVVSSTPRYERD